MFEKRFFENGFDYIELERVVFGCDNGGFCAFAGEEREASACGVPDVDVEEVDFFFF